jgi:uncharacterized membrane protein
MAHGHAHDHDDWPDDWGDQALAVRRALGGVAVAALVLALIGLAVWWPRGDDRVDSDALGFAERADATVTAAADRPCAVDPATTCRAVELALDDGGGDGAGGGTVRLETALDTATPAAGLDVGDEVVLNDAGPDLPAEARYSFADLRRGRPLALLAVVFALAVVALGRLRGLLALAGVALTFAVLLAFLFPALLAGSPPVGVALTAAVLIAFGTLYLAHGVNERTTVALLGTLASLALTAALAISFAAAARLSGLTDEDSLALLTAAPDLDFRGLVLAAVIIGALGVLDDVTVTQVSAVAELRRSDPTASRRQLTQAGIRIGRDHIASTVNTLVLAYSAAALPLLLIYSQSGLGLGDTLTSEIVAVEIVQTLVGSIGLVAAVPLTTALAAWVIPGPTPDDAADHPGEPVGRVGRVEGFQRFGPAEEDRSWYPPQDSGWPHRHP